MKKFISLSLFILIWMFFLGFACFSEEANIEDELQIDTSSINEGLSDDTKDFLNENNISLDNTESMTNITPKDVFTYVWKEFKAKMKMPLKTLACLLGAIMISSLAGSLGDTIPNKSLTKVYQVIAVMATLAVICNPISECIMATSETMTQGGNFMICYVPVFSGIVASAGNITSAVSYNAIVLAVAEIAIQFSAKYIMPLLSVCMALGIVEAINPNFNLSGITKGINKVASFAICFIMTIFVGLLSIQSIVGVSADTIGIKAAKFMASNFIPVVGSAVADAYTTLRSSLGLLRGGVGFIGILSITVLVLPTILEILSMRIVIYVGEVLSDMFGISQIKTLLANTSQILAISFSLLISFFILLVVSTTILMMVGLNIA